MLLRIAWRNLWRNRRRTQLTMGAMIFACAMLVFSLGYYDGMLWNMINNATTRENGHICLARPGYLISPSIEDTLNEADTRKFASSLSDKVKGVCPRINVFALLSCGSETESRTQPAQIMGIDARSELASSKLAHEITTGRFLDGAVGEIILGSGLAGKIKATIGSEIVFFSNAADGSLASELLTVTGIFTSGDSIRDANLALMNIAQLQQLMAIEGQIHSLRLFLHNPMEAEEVTRRLIVDSAATEATPWQKMFPQLADLLRIWVNIQIFTAAIYYAALALITFNTMYMAFMERMHEFAIMQAVGLTRRRLATLILAESLMMATLSGLLGTIAGTAFNLLLFYHPIDLSSWIENIAWGGTILQAEIFCVPSFLSALLPLITMILLGFVVAALPGYKLYRLKPVEALREA